LQPALPAGGQRRQSALTFQAEDEQLFGYVEHTIQSSIKTVGAHVDQA
jgi:hypothetical protein